MTDPVLEITMHLDTVQLVSKAEDEIRALCLGPNQKGCRRWTMCVPVQADDSDIVLAAAIRRLRHELQDEAERHGNTSRAANAAERKLREDLAESERQRWYATGVSWRQQAQHLRAGQEAAEAEVKRLRAVLVDIAGTQPADDMTGLRNQVTIITRIAGEAAKVTEVRT